MVPGALLGVVGGAGVLNGSKSTGSELFDSFILLGRGVFGSRELLLDWLQFQE